MEINVERALYLSVVIGLCIVIPVQYFIFEYSFRIIFFSNIAGVLVIYLIFRYLIDKRILKDDKGKVKVC